MIGCDCEVCTSDDPRDVRCRPSIFLEMGDGLRVLVDTTPDLRTQALRFGMGLDEVRRYNVLSKAPMPVYADTRTLDALRRTFSYIFESGAPKGGGVPDLRLWTIGGRFSIGRQEVVPVPLKHGSWTILGFRFGPFAYLTDCNGIPDGSLELLRGVEHVVLDALRRRPHPTHFTIDEAVTAARRIGAARTYFTHIAHELGHAATCASLPPHMALAHDGLVLDIL